MTATTTSAQASGGGGGTTLVYKSAANLPQSTYGTLFNVTGGRVRIVGIYGEVTTVIQTQATLTKLVSRPDVGAEVDLCANNDITADAVGTMYNITGTLADAMVATTSAAHPDQAAAVIVSAGEISLHCAASSTGQTKWVIEYKAVDEGAVVTAA